MRRLRYIKTSSQVLAGFSIHLAYSDNELRKFQMVDRCSGTQSLNLSSIMLVLSLLVKFVGACRLP